MKRCPACGEKTLCHMQGRYICIECDFKIGDHVGGRATRRDQRRYKRVLTRLDKIGARLANVRW